MNCCDRADDLGWRLDQSCDRHVGDVQRPAVVRDRLGVHVEVVGQDHASRSCWPAARCRLQAGVAYVRPLVAEQRLVHHPPLRDHLVAADQHHVPDGRVRRRGDIGGIGRISLVAVDVASDDLADLVGDVVRPLRVPGLLVPGDRRSIAGTERTTPSMSSRWQCRRAYPRVHSRPSAVELRHSFGLRDEQRLRLGILRRYHRIDGRRGFLARR